MKKKRSKYKYFKKNSDYSLSLLKYKETIQPKILRFKRVGLLHVPSLLAGLGGATFRALIVPATRSAIKNSLSQLLRGNIVPLKKFIFSKDSFQILEWFAGSKLVYKHIISRDFESGRAKPHEENAIVNFHKEALISAKFQDGFLVAAKNSQEKLINNFDDYFVNLKEELQTLVEKFEEKIPKEFLDNFLEELWKKYLEIKNPKFESEKTLFELIFISDVEVNVITKLSKKIIELASNINNSYNNNIFYVIMLLKNEIKKKQTIIDSHRKTLFLIDRTKRKLGTNFLQFENLLKEYQESLQQMLLFIKKDHFFINESIFKISLKEVLNDLLKLAEEYESKLLTYKNEVFVRLDTGDYRSSIADINGKFNSLDIFPSNHSLLNYLAKASSDIFLITNRFLQPFTEDSYLLSNKSILNNQTEILSEKNWLVLANEQNLNSPISILSQAFQDEFIKNISKIKTTINKIQKEFKIFIDSFNSDWLNKFDFQLQVDYNQTDLFIDAKNKIYLLKKAISRIKRKLFIIVDRDFKPLFQVFSGLKEIVILNSKDIIMDNLSQLQIVLDQYFEKLFGKNQGFENFENLINKLDEQLNFTFELQDSEYYKLNYANNIHKIVHRKHKFFIDTWKEYFSSPIEEIILILKINPEDLDYFSDHNLNTTLNTEGLKIQNSSVFIEQIENVQSCKFLNKKINFIKANIIKLEDFKIDTADLWWESYEYFFNFDTTINISNEWFLTVEKITNVTTGLDNLNKKIEQSLIEPLIKKLTFLLNWSDNSFLSSNATKSKLVELAKWNQELINYLIFNNNKIAFLNESITNNTNSNRSHINFEDSELQWLVNPNNNFVNNMIDNISEIWNSLMVVLKEFKIQLNKHILKNKDYVKNDINNTSITCEQNSLLDNVLKEHNFYEFFNFNLTTLESLPLASKEYNNRKNDPLFKKNSILLSNSKYLMILIGSLILLGCVSWIYKSCKNKPINYKRKNNKKVLKNKKIYANKIVKLEQKEKSILLNKSLVRRNEEFLNIEDNNNFSSSDSNENNEENSSHLCN